MPKLTLRTIHGLEYLNRDFANTAKQSKSHLLSAQERGKKENLPIHVPEGVVFLQQHSF